MARSKGGGSSSRSSASKGAKGSGGGSFVDASAKGRGPSSGGGDSGSARQALPFLDEARPFNQAMREARSTLGPNARFEYGGQTFGTSYGRDYDKDGRVSFGERLRDMTDRGGPGNSGGAFIGGGILSTIGNLATGQFGYDSDGDGRISMAERMSDMTDGGGAGRAGSRFVGGGTFGALGNMLGGPSAFRGGSGIPSTSILDMGGDGSAGGGLLPASPALASPVPASPVSPEGAPASPALPPNLAMLLPRDVSASPRTMFTFEDYLAQLGRQGVGSVPPAVQPLMAAVPQGIMSLPPAGLMG